jgi:hypothetical protein
MLSFLWLNSYDAKNKNNKKITLISVTCRIILNDYNATITFVSNGIKSQVSFSTVSIRITITKTPESMVMLFNSYWKGHLLCSCHSRSGIRICSLTQHVQENNHKTDAEQTPNNKQSLLTPSIQHRWSSYGSKFTWNATEYPSLVPSLRMSVAPLASMPSRHTKRKLSLMIFSTWNVLSVACAVFCWK